MPANAVSLRKKTDPNMTSEVRVLHVMSEFGRNKTEFLTRMATNSDPRIRNAVLCNVSHSTRHNELEFVKSLTLSVKIRSWFGRRVSSRVGALASNAIEDRIANSIRCDYAPDLIHVQDGNFAAHRLRLIKKLAAPIVTTFHGGDINLATYSTSRLERLQSVFTESARCHFVSNFLLKQGLKIGADPQKSLPIHLGTTIDDLPGNKNRRPQFTFACIANMVPCKGHETLLRSFSRYSENHRDSRLLLIGDGILRPRLKWLIERLELRDSVVCLGEVESLEIRNLLTNEIDVLVHPACRADDGSEEALGLALCEAGERGVPVISTSVGGISEVIDDGTTGLLVPERNSELLTSAMMRLHDNKIERDRLGNAARERIVNSFDAAKQSARMADLYCEIAEAA